MRIQNPRDPRTLEDPEPLSNKDPRGPRDLENPGPLRTQDPRGPKTLQDPEPKTYQKPRLQTREPFLLKENTLQSKMLIGSNDRIIENKNYKCYKYINP